MLNIEPDYMGRPLGGVAIICKRNSNLVSLLFLETELLLYAFPTKMGNHFKQYSTYTCLFQWQFSSDGIIYQNGRYHASFLDLYATIAPDKIVGDYNAQLPRCHD